MTDTPYAVRSTIQSYIGRYELAGRTAGEALRQAMEAHARYASTGITAHLREALMLQSAADVAQSAFDDAKDNLDIYREENEDNDAMLYRAIGKSGAPLYRVVLTTDDGDRYWDGDGLTARVGGAPAWDLEDAGQQSGKAVLQYWYDDSVAKEARLELA